MGVVLTEHAPVRRTDSEWSGKTVVITGSFAGFTRDQIKQKLIIAGAKVADAVSSKTDLVLVGTDPGSKRDKALALGITMQGEDAVAELMKT